MATHGRGLVCLGADARAHAPARHPADGVASRARVAGVRRVDRGAARACRPGSAPSDRATTILAAVAPEATSADLVMPGHVTPIQVAAGGTLVRAGLPEAAIDLVRLAGLGPEAVLCDGARPRRESRQRRGARRARARASRCLAVTVTDVIQHAAAHRDAGAAASPRRRCRCSDGADVPRHRLRQQRSISSSTWRSCWASVRGEAEVLVRLHSECLTGDVFGSRALRLRRPAAPGACS